MFSIHTKTLKSFGTLQDEAIRIAETAGLDAQQAIEAKRIYDNMKKNGSIKSPLGAWKWACEKAGAKPLPRAEKVANSPTLQRDYSAVRGCVYHETHSPKPTLLELAREQIEQYGFTVYNGRRVTKIEELKINRD